MVQIAEQPTAATPRIGKQGDPCVMVIFGAAGDLTARKLIPAFYQLHKQKQMPPDFRLVGFARREKTDAGWREELRQALEELPMEFREVIVLRELEGLSYQSIANIADIPIGTVMSRLARARRRLQQCLADQQDEGG